MFDVMSAMPIPDNEHLTVASCQMSIEIWRLPLECLMIFFKLLFFSLSMNQLGRNNNCYKRQSIIHICKPLNLISMVHFWCYRHIERVPPLFRKK